MKYTWFGVPPIAAVVSAFGATPACATILPPAAPVPAASASPLPGATPAADAVARSEHVSIHGQMTDTQQYHGTFPAAYTGKQSLWPSPDTQKTVDVTLFAGVRIGKDTEFYVNPEIDQGFGLGNPPSALGLPYNGTFGAAGFMSAEAYKVGRASSYGRIQRAFIRQAFGLGGGAARAVEPASNQLGGTLEPDNVIVTAGKFGVVDVFDTNPYAHDSKNDFLNWCIIDMGSFDYPADAWGYTYGVSGEYSRGLATARAGVFQLSAVPNQIEIEHQPLRQYGTVIEFEQRTNFFGGHPGALKGLVYQDTGYMGSYADALSYGAALGIAPLTADVRTAKHTKFGGGINVAQEVAPNVGVFARWSAMNGTWEAYDFSEIDRSISGGVSIGGKIYRRPNDTIGLAAAQNGISGPARQYFAAGGLGVLAGDGTLSYAGEQIFEGYYKLGISPVFGLTFDYQRVTNPAYNMVRGPVSVYTLRYHAQL
jgi:high affinity Mn2+ porin